MISELFRRSKKYSRKSQTPPGCEPESPGPKTSMPLILTYSTTVAALDHLLDPVSQQLIPDEKKKNGKKMLKKFHYGSWSQFLLFECIFQLFVWIYNSRCVPTRDTSTIIFEMMVTKNTPIIHIFFCCSTNKFTDYSIFIDTKEHKYEFDKIC